MKVTRSVTRNYTYIYMSLTFASCAIDDLAICTLAWYAPAAGIEAQLSAVTILNLTHIGTCTTHTKSSVMVNKRLIIHTGQNER